MKQEQEIKIGDVVTLRSGGPPMTVDRTYANGMINVKWFRLRDIAEKVVHRCAVRVVDPPADPLVDLDASSGAAPDPARSAPNSGSDRAVSLRPIEAGDGDLLSFDEFVADATAGHFVDSDGFGELATDTQVSDQAVSPSDLRSGLRRPAWATHVLWYNK
jgi:uncharacterized protein YodC (DUF2158 family)